MALADLGLKSMLVRHNEIAQTIHHEVEHVRGNDAVTQQCFSPLGPHGVIFRLLGMACRQGYSLEAIDTTMCYGMQLESKEEIQ